MPCFGNGFVKKVQCKEPRFTAYKRLLPEIFLGQVGSFLLHHPRRARQWASWDLVGLDSGLLGHDRNSG